MVKVTDNQIFITAGDSAVLDVTIMDGEETYDYSADTVKFGVKKEFADRECIIEKVVEDGKVTIEPEDTINLGAGNYYYDLKVVTENNDVCTVISANQFVVGHSVLKDFTAVDEESEGGE